MHYKNEVINQQRVKNTISSIKQQLQKNKFSRLVKLMLQATYQIALEKNLETRLPLRRIS